MGQEWLLPHEPELLYLREKVQRLEAELEDYRRQPEQDYSVLRPPETFALRGHILPTEHKIHSLRPLVVAQAENEPDQNRYHIILQGGSGDGSVSYGYYVSHQELYSIYNICGLMAKLHKRTVHSLVKFIEKKREARERL
jgi:hypothetical protein